MNASLTKRAFAGMMAALLAVAVAGAFGVFGVEQAWAGGQPYSAQPILENMKAKSSITTTKKGSDDKYRFIGSTKSPNKKISNVKSSNKNVATAKVSHYKLSGKNYYHIAITLKKTGTTNISFKWGSKKYTVKYTVKKYTNPVTSFKIGKTQYASGFAPAKQKLPSPVVISKAKSLTGKLQIKLAKGWKLKKAWYWNKNTFRYVKNGGKVNKAQAVWIAVKKGSLVEEMYVYAGGGLRAAAV